MKEICVVVVHYKGRELTKRCVESFEGQRVVVVDNGSPEPLDWQSSGLTEVIKIETNLGFTGGNNVGIKKALASDTEWIMLLNNDALLPADFFEIFSRLDLKGDIIAPKIYFAPGKEYHYRRYQEKDRGKVIWYAGGVIDWQNVYGSHRGVDEVDRGQYDQKEETDFASGCAMLVRREVFERVGLLDERYFLYLEDLEFCCRAKKTGFKVVFEPRLYLWHVNAGSSVVGGPLQDYFITRNRLLLAGQYASWRTKMALWREAGRLLVSGRAWQKKAVVDYWLRRQGRGRWPNEDAKVA